MALLLVDCGVIGRVDALWGYQAGDAVRERIAAGLREEVLRPGDFAGTLGRDELACVLRVVEGPQIAQLAAEKLVRTMNIPLFLMEEEIYASPSIGVTLFPGTADSAESLLQQAKCASTVARAMTSRIALYGDAADCQASLLIEEGRLRSAIADDALDMLYQPQFDLRFGQIMGVKAMLCRRDGGRGVVPMREAVVAAESGGLLTQMISALLNRALRNCSEFRQRAGLDLRIAVNLPARGLLEPELPELVERALRTWSLRTGRLVLEIEDLSELRAHASARAALQRLHGIGVKLSVDDARAPLSSLFWLADMPFQELKINLAIAGDFAGRARSESVLRSLIEMVHNLKLDVVAVAVPDAAAAARLQEMGCDFMQADFKGPAVDAEEFVERYAGS